MHHVKQCFHLCGTRLKNQGKNIENLSRSLFFLKCQIFRFLIASSIKFSFNFNIDPARFVHAIYSYADETSRVRPRPRSYDRANCSRMQLRQDRLSTEKPATPKRRQRTRNSLAAIVHLPPTHATDAPRVSSQTTRASPSVVSSALRLL